MAWSDSGVWNYINMTPHKMIESISEVILFHFIIQVILTSEHWCVVTFILKINIIFIFSSIQKLYFKLIW